MTTTKPETLARESTRYGYFRKTADSSWVRCPVCREAVVAVYHPWSTPREIVKFLRSAVLDHLTYPDECGGRP